MEHKKIYIDTASPNHPKASILIIYTGGTLGMVYNTKGALEPFDFQQILEKVPYLKKLGLHLTVISLDELIDSSNVNTLHWKTIGTIINDNYQQYDGFVVVHGTDTMAYSASALSYMLQGLNKPVIFTGAQLPIGSARSDARENLITSLEIASAKRNNLPIIPEVCIYFNNHLFRGNRCKKVESIHFDAFMSENYPPLAESGVEIDYKLSFIKPSDPNRSLSFRFEMDTRVAILKLFPGISEPIVKQILNIPDLRGLVIETFGSGNAPTYGWFLDGLKDAVDRQIILFNVSQCNGGRVMQGRYKTSSLLEKIGVLSGGDITTEAAITKMMFLLGDDNSLSEVKNKLVIPLSGEMS